MELSDRDKRVLEYIHDNPGLSKDKIARALMEHGARLTILGSIANLEKENLVACRKDKPNSQIYRVFINEQNKIATILTDVKKFAVIYSDLLRKSEQRIDNKDTAELAKMLNMKNRSNPWEWAESDKRRYYELELEKTKENTGEIQRFTTILENSRKKFEKISNQIHDSLRLTRQSANPASRPSTDNMVKTLNKWREDLIDLRSLIGTQLSTLDKFYHDFEISFLSYGALVLFYIFRDIIFFRSTIIWPKVFRDRKTLETLYLAVYNSITEIQFDLAKFLQANAIMDIASPEKFIVTYKKAIREENLPLYARAYWFLEMKTEIQTVFESLTKLQLELKDVDQLNLSEPFKLSIYYTLEKRSSEWLIEIQRLLEEIKPSRNEKAKRHPIQKRSSSGYQSI